MRGADLQSRLVGPPAEPWLRRLLLGRPIFAGLPAVLAVVVLLGGLLAGRGLVMALLGSLVAGVAAVALAWAFMPPMLDRAVGMVIPGRWTMLCRDFGLTTRRGAPHRLAWSSGLPVAYSAGVVTLRVSTANGLTVGDAEDAAPRLARAVRADMADVEEEPAAGYIRVRLSHDQTR